MGSKIQILVGCEESQTVCKAFRNRGFAAFSCDLQDESGGHPEWHIKADILDVLTANKFTTQSGETYPKRFSALIAHPPCTKISNAGARHLYPEGHLNIKRLYEGNVGKALLETLMYADVKFLAIENPMPSSIFGLPQPSQTIQPFEYGEPFSKKTYLWLRNLPNLIPTNIVSYKSTRESEWFNKGGIERQKRRSVTFTGIANAMAEQWGDYILKHIADKFIYINNKWIKM